MMEWFKYIQQQQPKWEILKVEDLIIKKTAVGPSIINSTRIDDIKIFL